MQLLSTSPHAQLQTGLPPSPTLTNPDMILPYNSPSATSTSPINPREPQRDLFQQPHADGSPRLQENGQQDMKRGLRKLFGNGAKSSRGDPSKATPLKEDFNGNVRNREHQSHRPSRERLFLTPSPTPEEGYDVKNSGDSRYSMIKNGHWEGFDGPVEELRADPYDISTDRSPKLEQGQGRVSPVPDNDGPGVRSIFDEDEDDPQSHAAMSKRAELILANAKERLLTMESNLNRARHGLSSRPSSSMSSFTNQSPEPLSLYTTPGRQGSDGLHLTKHRQFFMSATSGGHKGHTRVFSETSVPSPKYHGPQTLARDDAQKSNNHPGMDETTAEPSKEPIFDNQHKWSWTGLNRNGNNLTRVNQTLEPLHEDEPAPATFDSPSSVSNPVPKKGQHHRFAVDQNSSGSSLSDRESPTGNGLTRAHSTNQMRDLRDQMQELKGKISNLKQRAREDSMRRRSLQSLRTPSPFTVAEQWYTGAADHLVKHSHALDDPAEPKNGVQNEKKDIANDSSVSADVLSRIEPAMVAQPEDEGSGAEENMRSESHQFAGVDKPDRGIASFPNVAHNQEPSSQSNSDLSIANDNDPGEADLLDDDGASSNSTDEDSNHENVISPIEERHEDRPDAFDYEHFYLHSSMGQYGRSDGSRTSSHSSMYSVETTKPVNKPVEEPDEIDDDSHDPASKDDKTSRYSGHLRQNSVESVSTIGTFATATEGRASEEDPEEEEWVSRRPMAGSWQPDYPLRHKSNLSSQPMSTEGQQNPREIRVDTNLNKSPNTIKSPTWSPNTPKQPPNVSANANALSSDFLSSLSTSSSIEDGVSRKIIYLSDRDKELVERLIQSLSRVCNKLHNGTVDGARYESRLWRRRIDTARRVLDGETNGEAF